MIAIVGTVKSNFRDDIKANLVPLMELGTELAAMIRARVHEQGLAGDGAQWSAYASKRKPPKRGDRFYWTRPGEPQPELHRLAAPTTGKYAGRAAYPSYAHWCEAMGVPRDRKLFKITAELEESIGVTALSPARIEIAYNKKLRVARYGRAKSGKAYTNQKVAQFAFRTERMSPMQPSAAEIQFAADFVRERVPAGILKDLQAAEAESRGLQGANRVIRRANRLMTGAGVRVR